MYSPGTSNRMADKPLPQDGSYHSWQRGQEDKDSMLEKLLPQKGSCFGIPCGSEEKDNMLEKPRLAQPSFWNKNGKVGGYKAVLVVNGGASIVWGSSNPAV